ncbi:four helix bundle protein [bacterium]|nr:four helix bundle protein [bacterium]
MKDYKTLNVWKHSHELALKVYQLISAFPKEEKYGITSQLRRAATSIPTNIAGGCGRDGDLELKRFLQIAMGSASETDYLLLLSKDLNFLDEGPYRELETEIVKIMKMLTSFIKKLRTDSKKS